MYIGLLNNFTNGTTRMHTYTHRHTQMYTHNMYRHAQTHARTNACRYDPEDRWVTKGMVLGLLVIAAGVIAF
jgi:hypothetical protein